MELIVPNGAVELAVRVRGAGRPIVLVHGHGTSLRSWDPLAAQLERQYTVVAYDRRGHDAAHHPAAGVICLDHAIASQDPYRTTVGYWRYDETRCRVAVGVESDHDIHIEEPGVVVRLVGEVLG